MFLELFERLGPAFPLWLNEGFSQLLHEVPGIDDRARRIFAAALEADLISDITDLPGDEIPDLEWMADELEMFLNQLADGATDVNKEKELRALADYFERHRDDKGEIASGFLKYEVIPLSIDALKEEGLWDEEADEPIMPDGESIGSSDVS